MDIFELVARPGWWPPWMDELLNIINLSFAGVMAIVVLLVLATGWLALALCVLLQILSLFGVRTPREPRRERTLSAPAIEHARHRAIDPQAITHLKEER